MEHFSQIRSWMLKTAAAALCIGGGLTTGLQAQQVTDPSQTNPNYEQQKSANVPQEIRSAEALRIGNPLLQSSPVGNGTPSALLPSCFIPIDGSYGVCPRNDDGSFGPIALPFTFSLYGTNYNQVWINTNGNLTFTGPYGVYSASGFPFNVPMVAPFWADVDTRNISGGAIFYKVNPTNMIVTWNGVGYYNQQVDKRNTFQVVIGTYADQLTGIGQNVCFHYGDMQWTTGSASSGVGGFGGIPATVGINQGNGVNYVQIGRFNQNSSAYDGPGGANDGVNYLDDQCTCFNVTNGGNIPPTAANFPSGNTINVPCGQTVNLNLQFIAPEVNQTVTTVVNTGGLCNTTATVTNGVTSTVNLSITGAACNQGTHQITFVATDNGTPIASTTQVLTVIVDNCCTLGASLASVTDVSCAGGSDGAVDISYTGANGAVSFAWSNGATTEDLSGVPAGNYTVTVTDGNNCTAVVSATVGTTPDVTAPNAVCNNLTLILDNNGQASVTAAQVDGGSTDNCGIASIALSSTSFGCSNVGANSVTLSVTDLSGNVGTCTATITVVDDIAPSITCPGDLVLECRSEVQPANTGSVSASDNCAIVSIDHVGDADNGGSGCAGDPWIITRTYSATDASGNSSSCTQTITVEATPVVATASADVIVFPAYQDSACVTISAAGSGGCAPYSYSWSNGGTGSSQQVCPTSTTTYYVTVTDVQGCSNVDSVRVCAIDITCTGGTNNGQGGTGQGGNGSTNGNGMVHIAICHYPPGNPANAMTQCLPIPAAMAHITEGHGGDHLGACGTIAGRDCVNEDNRFGQANNAKSTQSMMSLMAYPNPFATSTTIQARFAESTTAKLNVYDMSGRLVKTLFEGQVDAGQFMEVELSADGLAEGMYMARLSTSAGESKTISLNIAK